MDKKACPNCNTTPMMSETRPIPREIPVPFLKTLSIEKHIPQIMSGYSSYTIYICDNCGKLDLFLHKGKATKSSRLGKLSRMVK